MKRLHTFEQFIGSLKEDTVTPPDDSKVEINDVITHNGEVISSEEILGIIISADSEQEVEDKMYDKFGQLAFSTEDKSKILAYYNDYKEEVNKKEQEEKEKEEEGDAAGGEDVEDLTKGL